MIGNCSRSTPDGLALRRRLAPACVTALLAGASGTGKTLAAQMLSNALRADLYRVDLSATVDKYIGETEKHLDRVFVAAEKNGWILLFDEADGLSGKRSDFE
jgi:ATP-dependent 26S proteasome regulatory subunit